MTQDHAAAYRIIDANVNRLREALRVIEELARFTLSDPSIASRLKLLRHSIETFERTIGRAALLESRDTASDPFSSETRPEELGRTSAADLCSANMKRAQEAARVLEEFVKVTPHAQCAETAKQIRFALYAMEQELTGRLDDGTT